jgi:very-short-patch-repair endonuclease
MTASEEALEPVIAALGERYRSQYAFLGLKHFADFALLDRKVIVEVDGASHDTPEQKKKDLEHTIALKALGWDVVRVSNEWATRATVEKVRDLLASPRTDLAVHQGNLERLLRDYPSLLVPPAKKTRKPRRSPAKVKRK